MNQSVIEQLKTLKLSGMITALKQQIEAQAQGLDFEVRLGLLLESELIRRKNNRITAKLRSANLRVSACFSDILYAEDRNLEQKQILNLTTFNWVASHQNLIITGATGTGKTYLASSFVANFCRNDSKALYFKASEIISHLSMARATGKYHDALVKLAKVPLLVIDEWLREPLSQESARDILDLFDERFRKASIIFCSQMPVSAWSQMILDPTCSEAILDRLVHDSIRIELKGDSMRQKTAIKN